jgi:hypothetical protein
LPPTAAQTGPALAKAPGFFSNQPDFYVRAAEIAKVKKQPEFSTALTTMQSTTVADREP